MYERFFGLTEAPFSIAPNPRYLYMSEQHKEALAHLFYGVQQDGGFVVLTGEVGTGKTTVCRCFLEQLPSECDVAFILNSKLTQQELLETFCDELDIPCPKGASSAKPYIDAISRYLLEAHSLGRKTLLIIDEAQNLSPSVLEQVRLLTNLETNRRKLLQIVLVGQPELQQIFAMPALRQLSQRVTARFHLRHLESNEVWRYICHRMEVAGCRNHVIPATIVKLVMQHTGGIPRLINVLCDRMLLGAYVQKKHVVTPVILREAVREVFGQKNALYSAEHFRLKLKLGIAASLFVSAGLAYWAGAYVGLPIQSLNVTKAIHPFIDDNDSSGDRDNGKTVENAQALISSGEAVSGSVMRQAVSNTPDGFSRGQPMAGIAEAEMVETPVTRGAVTQIKPEYNAQLRVPQDTSHVVSQDQYSAQMPNATVPASSSRELSAHSSELPASNLPASGSPNRAEGSVANASQSMGSPETASTPIFSTLGPLYWPDGVALADSQPRAVTTLLNLWGKHLGVGAYEKPCEAAKRAKLGCIERESRTLEDIRQMDRPVILSVADPRKGLFLATLSALNKDYAVLFIADRKVIVPTRVLTQQWTGEYVLFWQAPSDYDGAILPGAAGRKVKSFSRDLGRVLGSHSLAKGVTNFGVELEMAVRDFQHSQGLEVDGIAGVQTLISINTILMKGRVPTLSTNAAEINRITNTAFRKS